MEQPALFRECRRIIFRIRVSARPASPSYSPIQLINQRSICLFSQFLGDSIVKISKRDGNIDTTLYCAFNKFTKGHYRFKCCVQYIFGISSVYPIRRHGVNLRGLAEGLPRGTIPPPDFLLFDPKDKRRHLHALYRFNPWLSCNYGS